MEHPTVYRTIQVDNLSIFYREAGPKDAPTLLLLHGFPSSSRMFELGTAIDPIRFRANVYFKGLPAWEEQKWVRPEHVLTIGAARLRVVAPITRCAATEVNPETAIRDIAMVAELMRHYGHNIMGVYAEVVSPGEIGVGDRIVIV